LVETGVSVELREYLCTMEFGEEVRDEGEGPPVWNGERVENTIVNDKAPFATRFGDEESWGSPRGV
jgi:hypothetical protein